MNIKCTRLLESIQLVRAGFDLGLAIHVKKLDSANMRIHTMRADENASCHNAMLEYARNKKGIHTVSSTCRVLSQPQIDFLE